MKAATRTVSFFLALLADASGLLVVPFLDGQPLFFAALAVCYGVRSGPQAGGAWGFAGGTFLALAFADIRIGVLALGGLLAGCAPSALKRLLYWERVPGQAALGALSCLIFGAARLTAAILAGEMAGPASSVLSRLLLDSLLTGILCPLIFRLVSKIEGRR